MNIKDYINYSLIIDSSVVSNIDKVYGTDVMREKFQLPDTHIWELPYIYSDHEEENDTEMEDPSEEDDQLNTNSTNDSKKDNDTN